MVSRGWFDGSWNPQKITTPTELWSISHARQTKTDSPQRNGRPVVVFNRIENRRPSIFGVVSFDRAPILASSGREFTFAV